MFLEGKMCLWGIGNVQDQGTFGMTSFLAHTKQGQEKQESAEPG